MIKTPKKSQNDDEALDLATGILTCGLERIDEYVRLGPSKSDLGADSSDALARLLTKVAQVAGELRKAKAEERRRAELNTPESIIAAARALPARDRATVVAELERAGSGKSGLA